MSPKCLLEHVTPKGWHTIRYYGLYAAASKLSDQICREQCDTIELSITGRPRRAVIAFRVKIAEQAIGLK